MITMSNYEILDILKKEERILVSEIMTSKMKTEIIKREMKRLDELIPLINKGLQEALDLEHAIIVIKDKRGITIPTEELIPTLTLQSESGQIIGEEVYDPEELEELKDDPNVYFLSDNFPTYTNLTIPGEKQFFVVSQMKGEFEYELELRQSVDKLIIAEPSTEADHYIKDCYNISHEEKIATRVIGFNEKNTAGLR